MTYLGRQFSFASDLNLVKDLLVSKTMEALGFVGRLPLSPLLKVHALNLLLRAHLSFPLSHSEASTESASAPRGAISRRATSCTGTVLSSC